MRDPFAAFRARERKCEAKSVFNRWVASPVFAGVRGRVANVGPPYNHVQVGTYSPLANSGACCRSGCASVCDPAPSRQHPSAAAVVRQRLDRHPAGQGRRGLARRAGAQGRPRGCGAAGQRCVCMCACVACEANCTAPCRWVAPVCGAGARGLVGCSRRLYACVCTW